jgi:hypothetical protein
MKTTITAIAAVLAATTASAEPMANLARCFDESSYQSFGSTKGVMLQVDPVQAAEMEIASGLMANVITMQYRDIGFDATITSIQQEFAAGDQVLSILVQSCVLAYHADMLSGQ